ncbi:sensor histidine kinase [Novosphingobium malaysiense]|uniref:sensor histidine kinase n=1 Tax=Novosphingobium malaysiense TaxID=1348853 RepID=UPI001E4DCF40|nr:PAS domain-containing sensor histidine kinase [Novosphingobium malaysiense]
MAAKSLLRVPHGGNLSQSAAEDEAPPFRVYHGDRLVPPEELPLQVAAATGRTVARSECEIRFDDGGTIFISGHTIPLRDKAGALRGSIGAFIDITPRMGELGIADMMSREMSHRLKNNTALITAISRMTISRHLPKEIYSAYEERLLSLSRFKELGYVGDWKSVSWRQLIENSITPVVGSATGRVSIDGPDVQVEPASGQNLGMIFHELITNACKYGAMSRDSGRLDVSWTMDGDDDGRRLVCIWQESNGPRVEKPAQDGFGSRLIKTLIKSLPDGRVTRHYRPDGLRIEMSFQLPSAH